MTEFLFFIEVVVAGLLAGTMYSLVALGFVLIYKASSTFNFAQGAMVFFAVLAFVGFMELGLPFFVAFIVTILLMGLVGYCTERMVLIEHDMGVVMDISDRVVVLDYGKVIGDGTPDEVRANQRVIDAYLGVEH